MIEAIVAALQDSVRKNTRTTQNCLSITGGKLYGSCKIKGLQLVRFRHEREGFMEDAWNRYLL